jgi:hypothetical protein
MARAHTLVAVFATSLCLSLWAGITPSVAARMCGDDDVVTAAGKIYHIEKIKDGWKANVVQDKNGSCLYLLFLVGKGELPRGCVVDAHFAATGVFRDIELVMSVTNMSCP